MIRSQNISQKVGEDGEQMAREFLVRKGLRIVEINWRWMKYEIDIIATDGASMIFVEVKARSTADYGDPEMFVTRRKQSFLVSAANEYLVMKDIDLPARFDIVAITTIDNRAAVKHLEDAFYPIAR